MAAGKVVWTSDSIITFRETRVLAIVATKLALPKKDQVKEIERLCNIEHGACKTHFADTKRAKPEDLGLIVKAIESKPARGNPEIFGQKLEAQFSVSTH